MPLDNLIAIGGASLGVGSKRTTSNELTSGLISISGARDHVDVDMDDFDVGDLLGDDSGNSKSKSKDKSDDKKKKKSKDKEKSKTAKSKSKSKSKKNVIEDFANDDWKSSAKNWDSAAELEMATARRKTGNSKLGSLDDEFSKMLGLDSGSGPDFGSESVISINRDEAKTELATDDTFDISGYTPTVRGSKKLDRNEAVMNAENSANDGISASFFQNDDKSGMDSTPLSSYLDPPTERRGGSREGRRGAPIDSISRLDSAQDVPAKRDFLADLFPIESRSDRRPFLSEEVPAVEFKSKTELSLEPKAVISSTVIDPAKQQDDLLAELFATPSTSKKVRDESSSHEQKTMKAETRVSPPPKEKSPPLERVEQTKDSALSSASNVNFTSAKDSLLMDLLSDLSPPKPREQLSRRRERTNSNTCSPEKEVTTLKDPFSTLPPSPVPLSILLEAPTTTQTGSVDISVRPVTPPSPGRIRSLTVDKGALPIRDKEYEQSKESLLEQILPSLPLSLSARSSPHRRNSYSQSFEAENSITFEVVQEQQKELHIPDSPANLLVKSPPSQAAIEKSPKPDLPQIPVCNCEERQAELTVVFDTERAILNHKIEELTQQLETQTSSSSQLTKQLDELEVSHCKLTQQLAKQLAEQETAVNQLSQQLEAHALANEQLGQQLATSAREKLQADQLTATSKHDAAAYQHRAELLETEVRALREELSRSKRAVQDAELALARKLAEEDEVDQLERHREKRALEALSAQMQRALARLIVTHQVQEEGSGYDTSAARVAAEDDARLRVIASLEGSSKRAAQCAEQERTKLAELVRELEAGARNARQGALEDKERLRQEQQRLDALSAHLQAQTAALRDQETAHSAYMGQQLSEVREDARVYEARLATRRTQLERDERALYEARADFAAFREQTALEIEREHEQLRASRLALEDAWRELRADRENLQTELAGHENEFQFLMNLRAEIHEAEAKLSEKTQQVVALAEQLDAGTRDLLAREQLVAEQASVVQDTDSSMINRERAIERVKRELEAREQRLHVQVRQLDSARGRLTQQRREQQHLMTATRRHYSVMDKTSVDNNKPWRQNEGKCSHESTNFRPESPVKSQSWELNPQIKEDPSGLSPALRKQVEANWQRRNQQRRQSSGLSFDPQDYESTMAAQWSPKMENETLRYSSTVKDNVKASNVSNINTKQPTASSRPNLQLFKPQQQVKPVPSTRTPTLTGLPPPPSQSFQPTLRVNF